MMLALVVDLREISELLKSLEIERLRLNDSVTMAVSHDAEENARQIMNAVHGRYHAVLVRWLQSKGVTF